MFPETMSQRKWIRKALCLILAFCMCATPLLADEGSADFDSTSEEYTQGWLDGQTDAKGRGVWVLSGLLLGPIGIILPWVINPKVPGSGLVGKSAAYVEGYTAGYRKKVKPKNFYYSLIGFGVMAVAVVTGVLVVRAAESATETCCSNVGQSCADSFTENMGCSGGE